MEQNDTDTIDDFIVEDWLDSNSDFLIYYLKSHKKVFEAALRQIPLDSARTSIKEEPEYSARISESAIQKNHSNDSLCNRFIDVSIKRISNPDLRFTCYSSDVDKNSKSPTPLETPRRRSLQHQAKGIDELTKLEKLREIDMDALLNELIQDIGNETDMESLCFKILLNVSIMMNCDRCSLFLIEGDPNSDNYCLVAKVFDAHIDASNTEKRFKIRIPWGVGILGYVAKNGLKVNLPDAYQDDRFNRSIDRETGYKTKSILCMPIKNNLGKVIGVAEAINKHGPDKDIISFSENDEKIFEKYLTFCGIVIINARLVEKCVKEIQQNKLLIDFAKTIFQTQDSIQIAINKILDSVLNLIKCELCTLYLIQGEKDNRNFEIISQIDQNKKRSEMRLSANSSETDCWRKKLIETVISTKKTINIKDMKTDIIKYGIEINVEGTSIQTFLCVCITDQDQTVIGVVELINKISEFGFDDWDEKLFEAVGIFCGIAITNTKIRERLNQAVARQLVSLEVLSYHAGILDEDIRGLMELNVPLAKDLGIDTFEFDDDKISDIETCLGIIRIFTDLNFISQFSIDYKTLCKWILTVKKYYRQVTYHNWRHAFNVTQFMYCILTKSDVKYCLTEMEKLSLIVASICHDLDHRGFNNTFFHKTRMPLSQLYTTSTMEYHHFDQAMMILNFEGSQILKNLSPEDMDDFVSLLKMAIIATDLCVYFSRRKSFNELVSTVKGKDLKEYFGENLESRELLRCMLMTACDISGPTKPWEVQKRIASLVTEEFFQQGDVERRVLNATPPELMDREKRTEMPRLQVGFIESMCLPLYEAFGQLWPELQCLCDRVKGNATHWKETQFQ